MLGPYSEHPQQDKCSLGLFGKLLYLMRSHGFRFLRVLCLLRLGEDISVLFQISGKQACQWFSTVGVPNVCIHVLQKETFAHTKVLACSSSLHPSPLLDIGMKLCCTTTAAAFSVTFGNQACMAIRFPATCLDAPQPSGASQRMAAHPFAAPHVAPVLESKSHFDPGLKP